MKKILFMALVLLCLVFGETSFAQQKFALVIGNGNYTGITKLNNPVNDANDMASVLSDLGFTVDRVLDGNLDQMENGVARLKNRLSVSPDAWGFLFYAGHGIQSNGENYLIPVDANIQSESYLRQRAVSVQSMLDEINTAGNELNVIVLDACRDNPFSWRRSGSRGLSIISSQPADSIIVYATSAGSTAADGDGRNGLFTSRLLTNLSRPELEVTEVFRLTMGDVARVSGNQQRPAIYNQFSGTAYLGDGPGETVAAAAAANVSRPSPMPLPGEPAAATRVPKDRPANAASRLWTVGASVGSAFAAPFFVGTVRGTIAPLNYAFLELGVDVGLGSKYDNSGYFSVLPYAHLNYFRPFSKWGKGGFYAGLGAGYMIARYSFAEGSNEYKYLSGEPESFNIFTGNVVAGVNLLDMIDISYTFRTNFKSASNKLSAGYTYRFK